MYQYIITGPENHNVLDILPKRYEYYLNGYFREYTKEENAGSTYVLPAQKPYSVSFIGFCTPTIDKEPYVFTINSFLR